MAQPAAWQHGSCNGNGRFAPTWRRFTTAAAWIALALEGAALAWFESLWDIGPGLASDRLCWAAEWALWGGAALGTLAGYESRDLPDVNFLGRVVHRRRLLALVSIGWITLLALADSYESPWPTCLVFTGGMASAIGFHAACHLWPILCRGSEEWNPDGDSEGSASLDDDQDGGEPPWRRT